MLQVWHSTSVVLCHQLIIIEIHLYYAHLYKTIYPLLYKNRFINDISFQNVHYQLWQPANNLQPHFSPSFWYEIDFLMNPTMCHVCLQLEITFFVYYAGLHVVFN